MSAQFTITFQAGDINSLGLKDIGARRFTRMYDNSRGVLQGTICTGTAWDAGEAQPTGMHTGERPEWSNYVMAECGLEMFDPEESAGGGAPTYGRPEFYFLAVIEYETDGKVGYLARVREVSYGGDIDPAFTNQYDAVTWPNESLRKFASGEKSVARALDHYLFHDPETDAVVWAFSDTEICATHAERIAKPTLAEYAEL
jgi:hypothetical protein